MKHKVHFKKIQHVFDIRIRKYQNINNTLNPKMVEF
jgi:hypothetical protein